MMNMVPQLYAQWVDSIPDFHGTDKTDLSCQLPHMLTLLPLDKMAAISQTISLDALSLIEKKMYFD